MTSPLDWSEFLAATEPTKTPGPGPRALTRCEPSRLLRGSYRDLDLLEPVGVGRAGRGDGDGGGQGRLF